MTSRRQLLNDAVSALARSGASDARLDAEWMLASIVKMPRLSMLMQLEAAVSDAQARRYEAMLAQRSAGKPLQYILGEAEFMGHTFLVDERVLIPRPDTETLCEAAIARLHGGDAMLDIGTGSGALAVSVALACEQGRITAVDISEGSLAVARENGHRLGAAVEWVQSDLFSALEGRIFDVIVSNPPYIRTEDLANLQQEVRQEPSLALDGGADGLRFYRAIAEELPAHLRQGGSLLLEVGDGQAADVSALLLGQFESIEILRDLAGLERVVTGDGYAG